jgi:protein-S-isoprenylcysteine O-methyltransferase Ste14
MTGFLTAAYGFLAYAFFLATFLYAIAFVGNLPVARTIDSGPPGDLATAMIVNLVLLGLFAVQHSVMARPAFKRWWTRIIPEPAERSTYVLVSSLLLALLIWKWQPLPQLVWSIENSSLRLLVQASFWAGWVVLLSSTFMINHFDLFGLRQVYLRLKDEPYRPLPFTKVAFYKFVRHPIMLGFLIAFWSAPAMSVGHLLFSVATTGYIFIGIFLEERDLRRAHGAQYEAYAREAAMIVPLPRRRGAADTKVDAGGDERGHATR